MKTIVISGLCSVGKSSFVCALWDDATLLPTAMRDCTQTNTLVRVPQTGGAGETDRSIRLCYMGRERAAALACKSAQYHRVSEFVREYDSVAAFRIDELHECERLRVSLDTADMLFTRQPKLRVLHETLTDDLEHLRGLIEVIDAPDYTPEKPLPAEWNDRAAHLMGRRLPDGRLAETGRLSALKHVEVLRATNAELWKSDVKPLFGGETAPPAPPRLLDAPWIPAYHDARRNELILEAAREAAALVILSLPVRYEIEPWTEKVWRERPELAKRTLLVFNQIDTLDVPALFTRDGFAAIFDQNAERLSKLGLPPENMHLSLARLPFLESAVREGNTDPLIPGRIEKLRAQLKKLAFAAEGRPDNLFKRRLLEACNPADAGVASVRRKLLRFI